MKKGFTLIELLIVIIALGILVTIGFLTLPQVIEKAKAAEALQAMGAIRALATAYYIQHNDDASNFGNAQANIGTPKGLPDDCGKNPTPTFAYNVTAPDTNTVIVNATRCDGTNHFIRATFNLKDNTATITSSAIYGY